MDNQDKAIFTKDITDKTVAAINGPKYPISLIVITVASGIGLLVSAIVTQCGH